MIKHFKQILLILLIFISALTVYGQVQGQFSGRNKWYVNANAGFSQMYGDIQNEDNPLAKFSGETGFAFGLKGGHYFSPVFSGHFQLINESFVGIKESNGLQFESGLLEMQFGAMANLSNLFFAEKDRKLSFYFLAGISPVYYKSKVWRSENGEVLFNYGYPESSGVADNGREFGLAFPLGGGLAFRLQDNWYLTLETALRLSTTDLLDAYERGGRNDAYYYTSLGVTYNFEIQKRKRKTITPPVPANNPAFPYADYPVLLEYFIPADLNSLDEFTLTCKIYKGPIDGKGELTQVLPIGFNVLDTNINNARTEFKNYTLSMYWDELPADSIMQISYRVKLDKIYGSLPMTSIVYFNKTGQEHKFKTDVFIKRKIIAEPIAVAEEVPKEKEMTSPSEKVRFELQVLASYKVALSADSLKKLFDVERDIKMVKIDGWYKYSIGSFKTYEEAREYRKSINGKRNIKDPFIIAYYDNKRLNTLSELKEIAPDALPGGKQEPVQHKTVATGRCYRVQILALMHKQVAPSVLRDIYSIEEEVFEEAFFNWHKYTAGECLTKSEALKLRLELIEKGLEGVFIVKYDNGERAISD